MAEVRRPLITESSLPLVHFEFWIGLGLSYVTSALGEGGQKYPKIYCKSVNKLYRQRWDSRETVENEKVQENFEDVIFGGPRRYAALFDA